MKNKLMITTLALIPLFGALAYYIYNSKKDTTPSFKPLYIAALHENLKNQNVNLVEACQNMEIFYNLSEEYKTEENKMRLTYLCEDQSLKTALAKEFESNLDYRYFLDCAKNYSTEIQALVANIKKHYPEDHTNLFFDQENIILKYIKHPESAYYRIRCESHSEALYWKSVSESNKVEDLKFCIEYSEKCINGTEPIHSCPNNFKDLNTTCTIKLKSMQTHH